MFHFSYSQISNLQRYNPLEVAYKLTYTLEGGICANKEHAQYTSGMFVKDAMLKICS